MIYFDNAATTFPKPPAVLSESMRCMREYCGNPGRGSHSMAMKSAEAIYRCREKAAAFFSAPGAENVVFTMNTTYALNTAIKSVIHPGDHILISNMEHNSVVRPVYRLSMEKGIQYDTFDLRQTAQEVTAELERKIRPNTRAVVCIHASNICNITAPAAQIGALCRRYGLLFILDGAQSAGVLPVSVMEMSVDVLCVPGHKGLYGPQGCGMMIFGSDRCKKGITLAEGGSGMHSLDPEMPEELPERFEAGTLPTPSITGLYEGLCWADRIGIDRIYAHECGLWRNLYNELQLMKGIRVHDDTPGAILLFSVDGMTCTSVAAALDRQGICVRAGYHCAPEAHKTLGTIQDGAVRVSFGAMNTEKEVQQFCTALRGILAEKKV